ncbi:MAG: MFS transporter [Candidatus Bathyarchaeota archaeon]|nr:MAG: MFS transporter [Candidatus Bathyarchaeota archaeon]
MKKNKNEETDDFVFDKRLYIIFLIMFTEVLGFSSVLPLIPFLGLEIGLTPVQIGLIASVFSFCQLFASPITGKLSDHFGRKPLFILSQLSTFAGFMFLGFATTALLLIISRLIDGLLGSNMTVSEAYISDITEPKHRTRVYGYSSGIFGAGLIFGPVIGGLLSRINFSVPMFFAAGITLISLVLIVLFLPETITKKTEKISLKFNDVIPVEEVKQFAKTPKVRNYLSMFFVYSIAFFLFLSNFGLLAEKQFHVTADQVSFYMAWIGILRVIIQTALISRILRFLGENRALITAIVSMTVAMIILAFSAEYLLVFVPLIFLAYGTGVSRPIFISNLTNSVTQKETATILGVNNSLTSIAQIITPILGGFMIEYLPPQLLPLTSAVFFVSILPLLRNQKNLPRTE